MNKLRTHDQIPNFKFAALLAFVPQQQGSQAADATGPQAAGRGTHRAGSTSRPAAVAKTEQMAAAVAEAEQMAAAVA